MNNICFIPARSTSTRLKKKNIAEFCGGNLVTHTIKQAMDSDLFNRVILSSNDKKILNMGKEYNVELHHRDDKHDKIIDVMRYAIPELNISDEDIIGLLLVTCPLRAIHDIIEAYKIFLSNDKYHSVVSVKRNENPIQLSFKVDAGGHLIPVMPEEYNKSTRKQDHFDTFHYNDAIIFDTAKKFMDPNRNLFGENPIPYLMPLERSVAIDYKFQLDLARRLAEEK